jgi:hypothetical protein
VTIDSHFMVTWQLERQWYRWGRVCIKQTHSVCFLASGAPAKASMYFCLWLLLLLLLLEDGDGLRPYLKQFRSMGQRWPGS